MHGVEGEVEVTIRDTKADNLVVEEEEEEEWGLLKVMLRRREVRAPVNSVSKNNMEGKTHHLFTNLKAATLFVLSSEEQNPKIEGHRCAEQSDGIFVLWWLQGEEDGGADHGAKHYFGSRKHRGPECEYRLETMTWLWSKTTENSFWYCNYN